MAQIRDGGIDATYTQIETDFLSKAPSLGHPEFLTLGQLIWFSFNLVYRAGLPPIVIRASFTSSASESCNEAINLAAEEKRNHGTNTVSRSSPVPRSF